MDMVRKMQTELVVRDGDRIDCGSEVMLSVAYFCAREISC